MESMNVRRIIFLVFFLALFLLVARLFYPFVTVILWSGLIYILLNPLYERVAGLSRSKRDRPVIKQLLAGAFALLGVLILVVPLAFLAINVAQQVGDLSRSIFRFLHTHPEFFDLSQSGTLGGFIAKVSKGSIDLSSIDLRGEIASFIAGSSQRVIGFSGAILRNTASFLLALAFMVFTAYFFFMDGRHLAKILVGAIPIEKEYTRLFMRTLQETSKQLVLGYVLVALYQATAAFIIFSLFKVNGPLVLACIVIIASFIPMVGAGLVWLPVGIIRMASGDLPGGMALLLTSAFFISILDNFIRPILLKQRLNVHPLLIFFAILGGLTLFGFNGIILGPLILILFFTALGLYDKTYRIGDEERAEAYSGEERRKIPREEDS